MAAHRSRSLPFGGLATLVAASLITAVGLSLTGPATPRAEAAVGAQTWSDEFDGGAGSAPDATKWTRETGGSGNGNNELQYYTDSTDNAALDGNGHLVITARAANSSSD